MKRTIKLRCIKDPHIVEFVDGGVTKEGEPTSQRQALARVMSKRVPVVVDGKETQLPVFLIEHIGDWRFAPGEVAPASDDALAFEAESAGQMMFYGRGAGGDPTASAVMGDLVTAARNRVVGGLGPGESTYNNLPVLPIGDASTRYYVNLSVADRPGVLASIASAFSDNGVSIQVVRQDGHGDEAGLIVRTHRASDAALRKTVEQLSGLDTVRQVLGVMRVEGEAGA